MHIHWVRLDRKMQGKALIKHSVVVDIKMFTKQKSFTERNIRNTCTCVFSEFTVVGMKFQSQDLTCFNIEDNRSIKCVFVPGLHCDWLIKWSLRWIREDNQLGVLNKTKTNVTYLCKHSDFCEYQSHLNIQRGWFLTSDVEVILLVQRGSKHHPLYLKQEEYSKAGPKSSPSVMVTDKN